MSGTFDSIWTHLSLGYLDITTYKGMCVEAEHWYGKIKTYGGKNSEELEYRLNKKEAKSISRRDFEYVEGDVCRRFFTFDKLISKAVEVASANKDLKILVEGDSGSFETRRAFWCEDADLKEKINENYDKFEEWNSEECIKYPRRGGEYDWDIYQEFSENFEKLLYEGLKKVK